MTPTLFDDCRKAATFSPCRVYRYRLSRVWSEGPRLVFLMLNPSTADETVNDPTVERCERRSRAAGCGGLEVVNLFALRSTDPRALYSYFDPIGPDNDAAILEACSLGGTVIAAWGAHGSLYGRGQRVRAMLAANGIALNVLALNADGSPRHPLYVPYLCEAHRWETA